PAVERLLQLPRGPVQPGELAVHGGLVRRQRRTAAGEQVEDRPGSEPGRDEALVHAVPRHRIDQARRVAHEQRPFTRDPRARMAEWQPVPPKALEAARLEAVRLARPAQGVSELRPLALPPADSDVRVVAFREDPRVAARDVGELQYEPAGIAL